MASTSIQTVPPPAFDVFLNFRGADTRYKFTDHLYTALVNSRITTFRDDKELEMGKPISLELLEAIEKSRIAVIIFSENYASSTWCLEELAKIVECRDRGILTVLPIFYHVQPTDVRYQTNTFKGAFAKHEKRFEENPEKVQKWRAALTSVANLSGKTLKDRVGEADFIRSFVERLHPILKEKRSNDIEDDLVGISSKDDLVGIRSRVEEMILDLDLESTDVRIIGICERSGMGKTTLARAVFDKILNQFEACSFLENVREESKAHGLKTLQERLLCDIGKGGLRVKDEHKGMQVISDILHNKKALIVVDDVSERSQLEKLVGKRDLFGKGSRIIVTTEDKDLLASYEIKIVYKARELNEFEALQLFSLNAFHKPNCENDFSEYCNNFVKYAQGIPLVLKVLGSYLCTRPTNEWESAQNQLRAIPHEKPTKKLRIAFDGLGAEEKKLFLDIACFFKGEEKNRVADILESVYSLDINLKNLIDKSLITLVRGEKLWMHKLLQQMGWEIVSEKSEEARQSRWLWCCDDVLNVVKNNTGTKHIESMLLRLPPDEVVELNAESFSKMNKLRLLKICKVRLSCLSYLSNELCLLEWHDYPLESLPNSFQPVELVELIMPRSCLQQLPSEFSKLGKLKLIDLSDSQNLTRTPDFTGFSNIERLNFQGCTRLRVLHPSVGGLKRLILLNLKDCKCLENLPDKLNLESLKTLILSGCSRFKKFPCILINMRSLLELYLDGTAIEELPPTIGHLTGLTLLNLQDCKNLKSFPSDIHSLTSLEILTLSGCKCQPPISSTLTFPRLISFLFLSFLAWRYTYLRIPICATIALSTYCFHNARHSEPESINLLFSNSFSKFSTLVTLSLSDCNLLALPDDPSCLSSVEYLNLSKNNFICLPDYISELSNLKILFLGHCSKLKSLPDVPLSTRLVSVQGCTSLENYSNQVVVWTLGVAGFTIITCLGLAEDEEGTIAEFSLLDKHLLWQRYVKDQIHQMEGFCHILPQIEIPKWFKHQSVGSSRPIPLPSNLCSNKNWKGIALCVISVVPAHSNDVSPGEDTKYFHEFYCLLDKSGDRIDFKVPKKTCVDSFGVWLYISHARLRKHLDERGCITPFIGTNSPDIEIKRCGARILYKQDMGEFLQNLDQTIFGSPNDHRGELKTSQLSRLCQIASPPRSFAYQNGPAIKTQLPADLHDHSRWRPTPVTELLPSNETIQGECTSRETIFSNQVIAAGTSKKVIAAGTSKSSSQGSLYLGKISSSLECLLKHRTYSQDHYGDPRTLNQCLPQSEIPGWFKSKNIARSSSVTIELPLNLYDNLEWMGFAFCAVFSFQKHPTSVPMKGSELSFIIVCHLKTDLGCMNPLYSISERDVILSSHQRGFLWLSFIPSWILSREWSGCTSVEFSFVSDSSAVSALKCGVDLVYWQKLEFTRRIVQCITSYGGPFTSYERFPFYHPDQFSGSDGSSGTSGHYSYDQFYKTAALDRYNNRSIFNQCILRSEISEWFSQDSLPSDLSPKFDFHPSTSYNFCFPPSKIQDWFSHPNHGHSVTIDLPSNLYLDSNWMGLVLYASFSIHGNPNIIFSNLASGKSHFLYCQCQTSMANVDNKKIAFSTNNEEITWLLNLGEFIWICYVPGEPFKNMLPHCSHIEASFVSDWSGVIVQECALQLLYQHDQVQFEQELKHCNNLISENRKLVCKQEEDKKKLNEQYHVDEGLQRKIFSNIDSEGKIFPRLIDQPETDETEIQLGQSDLLENQEKVDEWRVASKELTKISREHLEKGAPETEFIRNIVPGIYSKLKYRSPKDIEGNLVGIASRVEEINSCLHMELTHDVLFIGIRGMSGMGKSTLAQVVFNRIHDQFEASSFLKILGEDSINKPGLLTLQEQLLFDICRKDIRLRDVSNGIRVLSNKLHNKKVLIVIDDVNKESQLENLVGKPDSNWLGPGSRIIVITENKHLLATYGIGSVFMAKGLNNDEALELFCLKAFHKPHCENDFLDLCNDFVIYAQGIPLVLEVLGSFLFTKTKKEWESARNQLRVTTRKETTEKLKIAFDGLDNRHEKKLFLDIACFFNGEDKKRVFDILEEDCYPEINSRNLIDRSLITVVKGKLWMHNLLQQMGWEIVLNESEDPEERSRLWLSDDVLDVLKNNTGTNKIEGMVLKLNPNEEEELNSESFSNMNKLRLLKICKVHLPSLSKLSNKLSLLEWHDYPLKSLPKSFQPRKLVELIMHCSCIEQLPTGFRNLGKLKLIDLSDSQNLTQTPDFIEIPNIERLNFQGCTKLHELHPSVGGLKQLIQLNLKDCKCLENLPNELNLESLQILFLSGCSKLNKFPEIGSNMTSLSELYLDGTAIEELPPSIKHLTCLVLLNLQDCKNLLSFQSIICSLTSLEFLTLSGCKGQQPIEALPYTGPEPEPRNPVPEPINLFLPSSFSGLGSLVSLDLSDCNLSDGELPDDLSCLSSLKSLNLSKNNFTSLPDSISELSELKLILLDYCSQLKSLPYLPLSTQFVSARGCSSLENYSNQVVVWTSGDAGFTFINCLGLADDEEGKIAEISLLDIHFQPLWQRFMEEQIHQIEGFYSVVPQTELPVWFNHQSSKSSLDSVPIQLPPNLFEKKSWKGIALCVIFEVKNPKDVSSGQDSKHFHEFICRLDVDGGLKDSPLVYNIPKQKFHGGSFGLWLFISHERFREYLDERSCISPLIKTNSQDIEIKMCGARVLYETDMAEFVEKLSQETFGRDPDLREKEFIMKHMGYSQYVDEVESSQSNGQIESNPRLKTQFKYLLSKLYQVDLARNHWYDYIFPQIARPPHWFNYQNFSPYIKMELPPDLHDNSRWLGFTVYAMYTIEKQGDAFSYEQDSTNSTILLRFSSLSASDEVSFAPYTAFPLSRDTFDESSQRLLVFYIPRLLLGMNRCSHIGALFESDNPGVQIGMCGIRLVYEKNVEEFVQTLVEYMLGTPEVYHQSIYMNLMNQLGKLQGCNHGADFCCTFTPERRPHAMHMPKLLPSNAIQEKIQEKCKPEIHSNTAGTSRNSDRSPIYLGIPFFNGQCESKMSSSLESWFKPYLQDHYNKRSIFNHCFPQSEIPEWFSHQSTNRSSVRMWLPPDLYDNPDWMGFAFCAVFSFHKHPTAVCKNLNSEFAHIFSCHLKTNLGCMSPLFFHGIHEDDVLISLHQRSFIWVSFIPRVILAPHWRRCTWVEFSFLSGSPDVSPLKCAVDLLYEQNLQKFTRTVVQCVISYVDYLYVIRGSCKKAVYERLPFYSSDEFNGSDGLYEDLDRPWLPISQEETSGTSSQYSYENSHSWEQFYKTGALDFNPCTLYNFCFPPSKIHEWFSHKNHGHSVTIDLPSNLYHDNNWMGLILYASFSLHGDRHSILNYLVSGIHHFLYCQCRTIMANVGDDETISCYTSREEITWLLNLGEFIWISYVPVEVFKNFLQYCNHIEASFVSDWPGVMVQECALHLLYQHDQVPFEQELRHCNDLILEQREIVRKHTEDYEKKTNEQSGVDEKKIFSTGDFEVQLVPGFIDQSKTNETKTKLGKSDLLDFDQCRVYNSCFPLSEIPEWFSHQSDEAPVTIPLPPNVFNDNTWMGLVLCASIAVEANPTVILDIQNSETSYNLICHLETNIECVEPLHVHHITEEDLKLLQQGGFIWLSYIPRGSFQESLNQCSQIGASVAINFPGLVQKSGFHLLYKHDEVEFKETIRQCMALFSNEHEVVPKVIDQSETNETKTQLGKSDLMDFDQCRVYKSCFPLREIPEWFSHQSNEAPVTIPLPPNVYNDSNWMGLALCAYVAIEANLDAFLDIQNSETSYNLICHLETSIECAEPLHVHHITKEDFKLLQQGGFIWLSYIPRGSFRDSLNQCSRIEASVVIDFPGLVQKCGFHLLYKHDEVEFKETIRQCVTLFSNEDEVSTKISSSSKEDSQSEPVEPANCKDKGKRVLEY